MMAAVQPFLSGAISKTVQRAQRGDGRRHPRRLPRRLEARPEGPGDLPRRLQGEPAGEHQVRDGPGEPKRRGRGRRPEPARAARRPAGRRAGSRSGDLGQPRRERLPHTRRSLTHKFDIQGHEGYVNVGFYPDGRPGELFITMAKEGSTIGGLMDVLGTSISIGLQYGVPLEVFVNKFAHSRFEPAGFTKNPDIPIAKSIADYIFRWLGMEFIPGYREANAPQRRRRRACTADRAPVVKVNGHRIRHDRRPRTRRGRHAAHHAAAAPPPAVARHLPRRDGLEVRRTSSSPTSRATPPPATTAAP